MSPSAYRPRDGHAHRDESTANCTQQCHIPADMASDMEHRSLHLRYRETEQETLTESRCQTIMKRRARGCSRCSLAVRHSATRGPLLRVVRVTSMPAARNVELHGGRARLVRSRISHQSASQEELDGRTEHNITSESIRPTSRYPSWWKHLSKCSGALPSGSLSQPSTTFNRRLCHRQVLLAAHKLRRQVPGRTHR